MKKTIKPFIVSIIFFTVGVFISEYYKYYSTNDEIAKQNEEYIIHARKKLEEITLENGINITEAAIIFEIYGYRFFFNHGWGELVSHRNNWEGVVLTHWGDTPLENKVIINKKTGAVSWKNGPSIKNYKELLEVLPNYTYNARTSNK